MRIGLVVVIGLALATPAFAQTGSPPPSGAQVDRNLPAASPRALALSRRYLELVQSEAMHDTLMGALRATVAANRPASVSPERAAAMDPAPVLQEVKPAIMDRMAVVQAQVYSEAELQALVDFFGSPTGRAIVAKQPKLGPGMTAVMLEFTPKILDATRRRLCLADPAGPSCPTTPGR